MSPVNDGGLARGLSKFATRKKGLCEKKMTLYFVACCLWIYDKIDLKYNCLRARTMVLIKMSHKCIKSNLKVVLALLWIG